MNIKTTSDTTKNSTSNKMNNTKPKTCIVSVPGYGKQKNNVDIINNNISNTNVNTANISNNSNNSNNSNKVYPQYTMA